MASEDWANWFDTLPTGAQDEIVRLTAENERLRAALRAAAPEAHDTETRVMSWVDDLLRAGGDDAVAFWHGYVSAEAEDPLAQLRSELAAAQAREQACMERIKDALDCLPRALDGSRPFSLDQRAEVMLAIEALRAALAAAGGEGQG